MATVRPVTYRQCVSRASCSSQYSALNTASSHSLSAGKIYGMKINHWHHYKDYFQRANIYANIYACIYFMLHFQNHSQTLVLKLLLIAVINEPSVRSGSLTYRPLQLNTACLLFLQIWFIGMQPCPFIGVFYLLLLCHNSGVAWLDR